MFLAALAAWILLFCGHLEPALTLFADNGQKTLGEAVRRSVREAPPSKAAGPTPIGNPATWLVATDYPADAIRNNWQGLVGFRLEVSTEGRVIRCDVTRSSTHLALDQAACTALKARAHFSPARDATGEVVESTYASHVRWQIPEDANQPHPVSF